MLVLAFLKVINNKKNIETQKRSILKLLVCMLVSEEMVFKDNLLILHIEFLIVTTINNILFYLLARATLHERHGKKSSKWP